MTEISKRQRVNNHKPHILLIAEDKANRTITNGFVLHPRFRNLPFMWNANYELDGLKGLKRLKERILEEQIWMDKYPERVCLYIIDFDDDRNRYAEIHKFINTEPKISKMRERIFVLGIFSEPESFRQILNYSSVCDNKKQYQLDGTKLENIGLALAKACFNELDGDGLWGHDLLKHNKRELKRIKRKNSRLKPILFGEN